MATSGSIDFSVTGFDIVNAAFGKAGVKGAEQALTKDQLSDGMFSLNVMVKSWQAQKLHLWTKTEGVIFLDKSKQEYKLGGSTGAQATNLDDFIPTTTNTAEVALATLIGVASTAGMVVGDNAGILQDDGSRHWTTITAIDPGVSITIDTGLVSAAASGKSVFTFTAFIERPVRILSSRRSTVSGDSEIEVFQFSRENYFNQPNKTATGTVVNFYYSPQLDLGRYYVWPTASNADDFIRFTYERTIEDFDVNSDNPDFPIEWAETIIWNLAARIGVDYNIPLAKLNVIQTNANSFLDAILGFDEEPSSLNIQPEFN